MITRTSTVSTEVCSSELAVALAALAVAVAVAETARSFFRLGLHCTMVTSALLNKRTVLIQSSKRYKTGRWVERARMPQGAGIAVTFRRNNFKYKVIIFVLYDGVEGGT